MGKGKAEAIRMKKKLESDVSELETSLEHANAANVDTQKSIKVVNAKIREAQNALEEARTLLEQADRARRIVEQELSDTNETLSELTCQNQAIAGAKRKLDSELQTINGDMDEMSSELGLSEDKAKKAMVDAARLADELRQEQELAQTFEKDRKLLECQ